MRSNASNQSHPFLGTIDVLYCENDTDIPWDTLSIDVIELVYEAEYFKILRTGNHTIWINIDHRALVQIQLNQEKAFVYVTPSMLRDTFYFAYGIIYLTLSFFLRRANYFPIHASAVAKHNKALIFTGNSRSGKTTTSLAMLRKGFNLLSDDTILLHKDNSRFTIYSVPIKVSITPETNQLLPELAETLFPLSVRNNGKYYLDIDKVSQGAFQKDCEPHLLFFPVITGNTETRVEPLSALQATEKLLHKSFTSIDSETTTNNFNILCALATASVAYTLYLGTDLERMAEQVAQLFDASL